MLVKMYANLINKVCTILTNSGEKGRWDGESPDLMSESYALFITRVVLENVKGQGFDSIGRQDVSRILSIGDSSQYRYIYRVRSTNGAIYE